MDLNNYIHSITNFPSDGIVFRDISPIFLNPPIFNYVIDEMVTSIQKSNPDFLAAIDSRGFLLGSAIANKAQIPLILIRKPGKLPPPIKKESYSLEYGEDFLEISSELNICDKKVAIIDDVLATGGTVAAAIKLIESLHGEVESLNFLVYLKTIPKLVSISNYPLNFLIDY